MTMDVSVIVCAYSEERWDDLVSAVMSLEGQRKQPREIIVVIDHNESLFKRVKAQFEKAIVVENQNAVGLSGARNTGVSAAKSSIIAFIDDDAIAAPDWLENLCAGYADANVIGVGGAIEPMWPSDRPAWFPEEFYWVVGCVYRGMPQTPSAIRNMIGANMSFRREVFERVGNFRLGKVGTRSRPEETELCIRTRQQWPTGLFLYQPHAKVRHRVSANRINLKYFLTRCYDEGMGKASMVHFVGQEDGLSSEKAYTLGILPKGVARGFADAIFRGNAAGLARAFLILTGLIVTTLGYFAGTLMLFARRNEITDDQMNPI